MNKWRRILFAVLSLCLFFTVSPIESRAADNESYTYTLTLYVGNQGEFSGIGDLSKLPEKYQVSGTKDKITISGLSYHDRVGFNPMSLVQLPKDSKYYVKGIRQSGRDNNTVDQVRSNSILVESDRDFVVAYGIKGDMVSYRVNYRDQAGNTLAPTETYYGNVGDKPVVAFLYIEGYEPQAYNLTRTLASDESKNEFTFVYRRGTGGTYTETVIDGGTNTVTTPGGVTVLPGGGNGNANQGNNAEANEGNGEENQEENENEGATDIPDAEVPQGPPGELMDLDEPEVPLAKLQNLIINPEGKMVYGYSILIGLAAVAALITMGVVFWKKRRAGVENEEIDNWELK